MMKDNKLKAVEYIDELAHVFEAVSDAIWENPELSMSEHYAAETYCKALAEQGFAVEEKICGIDTAFCGSFGSGKPVIGILAEYDSLSGLKTFDELFAKINAGWKKNKWKNIDK